MIVFRSVNARILASLFFIACAALAQSPTRPQSTPSEPVTTFKANTRNVLLDVIVADKQGKPVTDLKREEITIYEQGKPQKMASFALVDDRVEAKRQRPTVLPGVYYNGPEIESVNGQITVLLLDALNTKWADQVFGRQEMLKYVKAHSGQRMAIFGLTDSLLLLQNFTDDPNSLSRVIHDKGISADPLHSGGAGPGNFSRADRVDVGAAAAERDKFSSSDQTHFSKTSDHLLDLEGTVDQNIKIQKTLEALRVIAKYLAPFPGRKKLVWMTGSLPITIDAEEIGEGASIILYADEMKDVAVLIADAQIAVYPIDPKGMEAIPLEFYLIPFENAGMAPKGNTMLSGLVARIKAIQSSRHAMERFAEATGGLASSSNNDIEKVMENTMNDGSTYYALSYSPQDKRWNGRARKLEVKISRAGLQLRYRREYYALDPLRATKLSAKKIAEEMQSALVSPLLARGVSFYGSALPAETIAGGTKPHQAEVRFLVDPKNIAFGGDEGAGQKCSLNFLVGVYSGEKLVASVEKKLEGDLKSETFSKMTAVMMRAQVDVPVEKVRMRLIVRDNRSGKIGALDVPYPNEIAAK
ncbi:MAG: hypothetical protein JWO13_2151 [Acidobacteriales bacterium]|nr:hypothetical protein [Terriglobales bacterium]